MCVEGNRCAGVPLSLSVCLSVYVCVRIANSRFFDAARLTKIPTVSYLDKGSSISENANCSPGLWLHFH